MKATLGMLAVALIAGGTLFAQPRVSIGVSVGGYGPGAYPLPAYAQYQPPCPGPGYTWVDGYWAPQGKWTAGYWRAPAVVVAPRFMARHRDSFRGPDRDRGRDDHARFRGNEGRNGFRR